MLVFLDTEFTDLAEPYLISVAMITDGRELYVELAGTSAPACSEFVRQFVLPHLHGCGVSPIEASIQISEFLAECGDENIEFFCDAPRYDIDLIQQFVPKGLRWSYAVPSFENDDEEREFDAAREQAYATGLRRHHALDDARAMAVSWTKLHAA